MEWKFINSGISLKFDWEDWNISRIHDNIILLSEIKQNTHFIMFKELDAEQTGKMNVELKKVNGIWLGKWYKNSDNHYKGYLLVKGIGENALLIEAVSLKSKDWVPNILNNISDCLCIIEPVSKSNLNKNHVKCNGFKVISNQQEHQCIDIFIKGNPNTYLIDGIQIILFDKQQNYINQVVLSGNTLKQHSSIILDDMCRYPFSSTLKLGQYFYLNYICNTQNAHVVEIRICVFSLSTWQEINYSRKIKLSEIEHNNIGFPLEDNWEFLNVPSSQSLHMDAVKQKNKSIIFPQKYAVDLVHREDLLCISKKNKPSEYTSFGSTVYAVEDGEVVYVQDGVHDNRVGKVNYCQKEGNNIVIKHKENYYSFYAHLKQNSIKVSMGQKIVKMQPIAEVGNSGNSTMPHLHFQLSTSQSPLLNKSLPFTFNKIGWPL